LDVLLISVHPILATQNTREVGMTADSAILAWSWRPGHASQHLIDSA
jgi:hypothetical protein